MYLSSKASFTEMYVCVVACTNCMWQIEQVNCMHVCYGVRVKCFERLLINNNTEDLRD